MGAGGKILTSSRKKPVSFRSGCRRAAPAAEPHRWVQAPEQWGHVEDPDGPGRTVLVTEAEQNRLWGGPGFPR